MSNHKDIQRERLFYLEFLALFTGQVSRKDLVTRFGISDPAATKDLSAYTELAPGRLQYDLRRKCYVLVEDHPHFSHDVDQALYALAGERAIAISTQHAKRLPSWVHCDIKRKTPLSVAAAITRCMYQGQKLIADYSSLSSGTKKRTLAPLALVNDGLRWHVRCFDFEAEKDQFRDYNLARFGNVSAGEPANVSLQDDPHWMQEVSLKLVPHPKAKQPETIKVDYDFLGEDAKYVTLKSCLVAYFLRHWHIDYTDEGACNPKAQQLFLANKKELIEQGLPAWTFNI